VEPRKEEEEEEEEEEIRFKVRPCQNRVELELLDLDFRNSDAFSNS
jgi:hypothetical protein